MREMSGKEIVKRYLRDNWFDGLYCFSCYESCGCEIDDLMPCDSMTHECYPGIKEITKKKPMGDSAEEEEDQKISEGNPQQMVK